MYMGEDKSWGFWDFGLKILAQRKEIIYAIIETFYIILKFIDFPVNVPITCLRPYIKQD